MNRGAWARDFLSALGNSSPDARTVNWVASWTLGENTRASYNPLATTQPMPGSTCYNCPLANVQSYPDHSTGIQASVKTVSNGRYPHILNGLKNNDPEEASNAVELGTWGTGMGFVSLWRLGDHTNEPLKSHEGGAVSGGVWGGGQEPMPDRSRPSDEQIGSMIPDLNLVMPDSATVARSLAFIGLGSALLLVAIIMAVRTYVPTEQIVKTVAMAA